MLDTNVPALGSVSTTLTPAAVADPVFVTVMVKLNSWLGNAPVGPVLEMLSVVWARVVVVVLVLVPVLVLILMVVLAWPPWA